MLQSTLRETSLFKDLPDDVPLRLAAETPSTRQVRRGRIRPEKSRPIRPG
jgi:hypothetical protein